MTDHDGVARVTAPDGRWHTTTFIAALRVTGLTAPAVLARNAVAVNPSMRKAAANVLVGQWEACDRAGGNAGGLDS